MKRCLRLLTAAVVAGSPFLFAQEPAAPAPLPPVEPAAASPQEAALQKLHEEYTAAFNKADAAAVAAFYDETATYSSDSGKFMEGRAKIEEGLKKYFEEHPGARLAVQSVNVRPVTTDVVTETGFAVLSETAGAEETTRFKAVYAKRGEAWRIVEIDETVLPPAERGQLALHSLDWMVGSWKDSAGGDTVTTTVAWTKSQRFLRRSILVKRGEEETLQATEIIGWDPAKGHIRSWLFDSEGGFGEGAWTQEGDRWIVKTVSTLPDGQQANSINIFTMKDDKAYTWESTNREVEGEVLPNIEKVEVVRLETASH